jgi:hypothetical protein
MDRHAVFIGKIKRYIGPVQVVVREIFLDDMPLIPAADHEIMEPEAGVIFHDVPKDWLLANGNHRLGFEIAFLADTGTQTPC